MGEESDAIKLHIEEKRAELGRHLNELEVRVKEVTDVRTKFRDYAPEMLGGAFGVGLLLGLIV